MYIYITILTILLLICVTAISEAISYKNQFKEKEWDYERLLKIYIDVWTKYQTIKDSYELLLTNYENEIEENKSQRDYKKLYQNLLYKINKEKDLSNNK